MAPVTSTNIAPSPPVALPTPLATLLGASRDDVSGESDPWAPDPLLDGALAANMTTAPASAAEAEAVADAATALEESGFGSALHTALGELRRIADDPVVVPTAGVGASSEAQGPRSAGWSGPEWPSAQMDPAAARFGGNRAEWLASLGDWWTTRWRDLLPGMLVALLVVVAFAVVLATGGKRASTSHVDTRRPIDTGPSTTIAGLFTTAGVPPGDTAPPDTATSTVDKPTQSVAPATSTPSSSDTPAPTSAPTKASNPSDTGGPSVTSPPDTQVSPPPTTPDTTPDTTPSTTPSTTPRETTTVPTPPPTVPDICVVRPSRC